jgi:TRAP-type C4-dicarboxylate transport system permease small subunit
MAVWLAAMARVALLLLGLIVTIGVVSRAFWHSLIADDVLLVAELMLVVIIAPLALVTARREHIVVGVFTERAGSGIRRLLSILEQVIGLTFFGVLAFAYLRMFSDSWVSGEIYESDLQIPMWPGHAFASICLLMVLLHLVRLIIKPGEEDIASSDGS